MMSYLVTAAINLVSRCVLEICAQLLKTAGGDGNSFSGKKMQEKPYWGGGGGGGGIPPSVRLKVKAREQFLL